ncbi:hypothetical protein [Moheibacter stercoris]|uniref:Lipoprotein n=1 Tax=Moheibacter stercoris TaxID=1628251 RepID=A0ABV2LPG5_9FLAO
MKLFSKYFLFIFLLFINWITLSCKENQLNSSNNFISQRSELTIYDTIEFPNIYHIPSLQELTLKSSILSKEAFGIHEDEIRFITGDIIILSIEKKLIYIELLAKTTEDNSNYIQLISQNLNDNKFEIIKKWEINNSNGEIVNLKDFFHENFEKISLILKNENSIFLSKNLEFKDYSQIQNIILTEKFEEHKDEMNDLKIISQLIIKSNQPQPLNLSELSQNQICPNCDSLLIYKSDFLGELISTEKELRILIIGILEHINHSPSALQIRLINLNSIKK